ncbi:TPA: AAA family ATPase, partial [Pseudomonas aeruginosa]|nr:AAA family ATPase [Pseudomonas aeruginosa]
MRVVRLGISNFRGIKSAELLFDGHTLMVGSNNVGKSTICDALDLVLGPDRLNRFPPIDEFDFYNAQYLATPAQEGAEPESIPLRVEVVLIELSAEIDAKCGGNTEFWHLEEQRLLGAGEVQAANPPHVVPCLRLE